MPTKPRTLNDEELIQVEKLAAVLNDTQISDYLGISHDTFTRIKKRQPEVMRVYKKGKTAAIANVAKSLVSQAIAGNTSAMIFFLKTQAGWRETQELTVSSGVHPLVIKMNGN